MDSLSGPRPSPFKHKRDPPPWNNQHEDLKRAAVSSLDKDLHQWKHGHAGAKQELDSDGGMNLSRLDKARSFATKEAASRNRANPENLVLPNTERSGNCVGRRPNFVCEKEGLEMGKTQKGYGGGMRCGEKKNPMPLSGLGEDARSGKISYGKNVSTVALGRSSSLASEKSHLKQVATGDKIESMRASHSMGSGAERSLKHAVPYENGTSVAPGSSMSLGTERSGLKRTSGCDRTAFYPGRKIPEKESLMPKDCKRVIKLRAMTSAVHDSKEVVQSRVKEEKTDACRPKGIKTEEKQSGCSSKSLNGNSDELSWKSFSSVKDQKVSPPSSEQISDRKVLKSPVPSVRDQKVSPSSSEQISDWKVLESPVPFLHIARRARSERRRDDSSRSQSSKGVSLDGFGAELEEALLKRQEAEVDSGARLAAGMDKCMADMRAVVSPMCTDTSAELVGKPQEPQTHRLMGLEQSNEREEGELEPEDVVVEKHSSEAGDNANESACRHDKEVERNVDKCSELACTRVCEMNSNVTKLKSMPSVNGLKSGDVCVPSSNNILAVTNNSKQGKEVDRNCYTHGDGLHGGEQDNGHSNLQHKVSTPSSTTEANLTCPIHADLSMHQSNSASHTKGFGPTQAMILSLSTQAPETSSKVSKDDSAHAHELSKLSANSGGKQVNVEIHVQAEIGAKRDSAAFVQEQDELSAHEHKQKKLKVGSLQLSLALPGYSTAPATFLSPSLAGHTDHEKSLTHFSRHSQSMSQFQTETVSDGFTTSLSLSSFVHNPSCSLHCAYVEDQELSCGGSRQIVQGWANSGGIKKGPSDVNRSVTSLSRDKQRHKAEAPLRPQILLTGNTQGHTEFSSHTEGNKSLGSDKVAPRDNQIALGNAAQASRTRGSIQQDGVQKFVNQTKQHLSVLSKSTDELPTSANKVNSERNKEKLAEMKNPSSEKVGLLEISSEPVAAMAQKLQELPDSFLEGLKGLVKELLGSFAKRDEFLVLQQIIRSRMDLTEETLLLAHPTQLEILVALKTGMQSFVQKGAKTLTYKALTEIFFQTRCRNVDCQQSLPVDGCECKVCSQKKGFCHECMCMVCSKFDSDSKTSRWVGCDICMHWCHTDCGLRMSHIKSTSVSQKSSEMQFRCLSCDHHMELYGFVKGVFENFARSWNAETLAKELDCVRRIFHASEDARGKQLRWKAEEMLQKLENNVAACDVCSSMLHFFTGDGAKVDNADHVSPRKAHSEQANEALNRNAEDGNGGFAAMGSIVARKLSNLVEVYDNKDVEVRKMGIIDEHKEGARERVEDDLHNTIGVKLTDVLMYQARADAAREDAIKLQHIILSKARSMEEDFSLKGARLRLDEVEERRRKLLEELQALEKSHRDFEMMKVRIESDMKHLMVMSNLQVAQST